MAQGEFFTVALILTGAGIMALAIGATARVLRVLGASRYHGLWRALLSVQVCFLLGYLAAGALVALRHTELLHPLVGGVFCTGALFVLLVARLGAATIIDLQEARGVVETASRARSTFLANMSHELRTPLNAIIGYSDLLLEEGAAGSASHDLRRIRGAGIHLLSLIDDILDQAKIESGRIDLRPAPLDLAALLDAVTATVGHMAERNGNQLSLSLDADLPTLVADELRLRQILLNLLSNACKFTEGGSVCLSVRRDGATLRFTVRDTGIGMSREQLARIFQPFVQATGHTMHRYGGTGLGLVIARDLARIMGGDIGAVSAPGRGSAFTLLLPITPPAAIAAPAGPRRNEAVTLPKSAA